MKKLLLLVMAVVMVGCVPKYSRQGIQQRREASVEQRLKEIDEAAKRGDITEIQRQTLKTEALKILRPEP